MYRFKIRRGIKIDALPMLWLIWAVLSPLSTAVYPIVWEKINQHIILRSNALFIIYIDYQSVCAQFDNRSKVTQILSSAPKAPQVPIINPSTFTSTGRSPISRNQTALDNIKDVLSGLKTRVTREVKSKCAVLEDEVLRSFELGNLTQFEEDSFTEFYAVQGLGIIGNEMTWVTQKMKSEKLAVSQLNQSKISSGNQSVFADENAAIESLKVLDKRIKSFINGAKEEKLDEPLWGLFRGLWEELCPECSIKIIEMLSSNLDRSGRIKLRIKIPLPDPRYEILQAHPLFLYRPGTLFGTCIYKYDGVAMVAWNGRDKCGFEITEDEDVVVEPGSCHHIDMKKQWKQAECIVGMFGQAIITPQQTLVLCNNERPECPDVPTELNGGYRNGSWMRRWRRNAKFMSTKTVKGSIRTSDVVNVILFNGISTNGYNDPNVRHALLDNTRFEKIMVWLEKLVGGWYNINIISLLGVLSSIIGLLCFVLVRCKKWARKRRNRQAVSSWELSPLTQHIIHPASLR